MSTSKITTNFNGTNKDLELLHQIHAGTKKPIDVYYKFLPYIKKFSKRIQVISKGFILAEDFTQDAYFLVEKAVNRVRIDIAFPETFGFFIFIRNVLIGEYRKQISALKRLGKEKVLAEDDISGINMVVSPDYYSGLSWVDKFDNFEEKLEQFKMLLSDKELLVYTLHVEQKVSLNSMKKTHNIPYSTANYTKTTAMIKFAKFFDIQIPNNYIDRGREAKKAKKAKPLPEAIQRVTNNIKNELKSNFQPHSNEITMDLMKMAIYNALNKKAC